MRLIGMSLWLAILSITAFAQQPIKSAIQAPAKHTSAGSGTPTAQAIPHMQGRRARSKGARRVAYRPEYPQNTVEVITGNETRHVVFENAQPTIERASTAPLRLKVEVVNGTSSHTEYFFSGSEQSQGSAESKRPVVVGIQSSDTHMVGGNRHPVVTSITTSGAGGARTSAPGSDSFTNGILPRPKRPAYRSDAH